MKNDIYLAEVCRCFGCSEILTKSMGEFVELVFVSRDDVFCAFWNVVVFEFCLFDIYKCFFDVDNVFRKFLRKFRICVLFLLFGIGDFFSEPIDYFRHRLLFLKKCFKPIHGCLPNQMFYILLSSGVIV